MPTNHTPTAEEVTVAELPNDGEVWNYATVMKVASGNQGPIAKALNYGQWVRENVVNIQFAFPTGSGTTYTGSSWTDIVQSENFELTFTDVEIGDKFLLFAVIGLNDLDSVTPSFRYAVGASAVSGSKATTATAITPAPIVISAHTATVETSSLAIKLQINPAGAASGVEFDGAATLLAGIHHRGN